MKKIHWKRIRPGYYSLSNDGDERACVQKLKNTSIYLWALRVIHPSGAIELWHMKTIAECRQEATCQLNLQGIDPQPNG